MKNMITEKWQYLWWWYFSSFVSWGRQFCYELSARGRFTFV